jgi:anti-anti-sigma regulatory factor
LGDPVAAKPAPGSADVDCLLAITSLAGRAGLRLDGEADVSTQAELHQAISELPVDGGTVHLELSGLRFIDVVCTRELMMLTVRHPGLRLVLHSPPPHLEHMISLLWPGTDVEVVSG